MTELMPPPTEDVVVNVRRALRKQLLTVASLPEAQQWEGSSLTWTPPTDGSLWLRETMLRQPGPPPEVSIGTNARIRNSGGYQISLFAPPGQDEDVYPIESLGGEIRAAFPHSLDLVFGNQFVRCTGCGLGTVVLDTSQATPWLHLPVRVTWYADTFNPI